MGERPLAATAAGLLSACAAPGISPRPPVQGVTAYQPVPAAERRADPDDPLAWESPPGLADHGWSEWFSLVLGERNLDPSLSGGAGQLVTGLELWGAPRGAWVGFEVGLYASAPWDGSLDDWADSISGFPDEEIQEPDDDTPVVDGSSTVEFSLGLRKELYLLEGRLRPYVSGGVAALRTRTFQAQGANGVDDADGSVGLYGQVGLGWVFLNGSRIGFGLRWFDGPGIELDGLRARPDYDQWYFSFGSAF